MHSAVEIDVSESLTSHEQKLKLFCALLFMHISLSCSQMIKGTLLPVLWYWNICRVTFSTGDVQSLILVICQFRFLCKILKYIVIRQEHFSSHSITKFNNIQANFIRKHVINFFDFTLLLRVMVNHCSRPLSSWPHSSWPVSKQSSLSHCFLDVA